MDAHETIACDSEICAAVVGRSGDFVLIRLDIEEAGKQAALEGAIRRGFGYCGVLGLKSGKAAVAFESDPDSLYTMMLASFAFAEVVAGQVRAKQGDAADWLTRLHRLPDSRD